jgi:hypothetical protein
LKIAPLVFTTGLRLLSQNFYNRWGDVVNEFSDNASNGSFEQYTVFAFDWFQAKYGLASTFLYTGLLAIYTSQQSPQGREQLLIVFGIAAFGFAVASAFLIDRWFNKENYRPEPYYRYFYRKGGNFNEPSSKKNLKIVEDQFFSKHLSPSNVTLASELFLLLAAIWIVFELPVPLL